VMGLVQVGDLALSVGQDTGFKVIGDVRGKKIAAPSSGAATTLLGSFFKAIDIPQSEVNVVYVDSTALLGAFSAKSVDGIVAGASFTLPRTMHLRPSNTFYFSDFGLNLPGYGLVVHKDALTKKADMLRKIIAVQQRAWAYIQQGHEREAVDALALRGARFKPNPDLLQEELKLLLARFATAGNKGKPVGYQAASDWQQSLAVMEKANLVKPGWKANDYFDNRFVEGN
jgi:NitT/TauT family transport system substrate-binding protein